MATEPKSIRELRSSLQKIGIEITGYDKRKCGYLKLTLRKGDQTVRMVTSLTPRDPNGAIQIQTRTARKLFEGAYGPQARPVQA